MLKIAISGNIASGKSTVEKIIEKSGYRVYDTDKIAHVFLESSAEVKKVFNTTNRKEISKVVFNNEEKLKQLESIIHPLVKNELENIFKGSEKIVFIAVPQLFESGFDSMFDKIIFVSANIDTRLKRLMMRNVLSRDEALKRIMAQDDEIEKIKKSDYVIINNGDFLELEKQVKNILDKLILVG